MNWDKELDEEAERQRRRKKEGQKTSVTQNALPPVKKPEVVPQLPKPQSSVSPKPNRTTTTSSATLDLLGLGGLSFDLQIIISFLLNCSKFNDNFTFD